MGNGWHEWHEWPQALFTVLGQCNKIASGARWLVNIQAWHRPAAVRKST